MSAEMTWDKAVLAAKKIKLDRMACELKQPSGDGCIGRLKRELLEAESSQLTLRIAKIERAQRSST